MSLKLEFVGCGAGFSIGLGNNNVMIYDDDPSGPAGFWLIDCGETTRVKLVERGLIDKCKGVIVTHVHGDHVYDLEMMGFWWRFVKHKRLRLCFPSTGVEMQTLNLLMASMKHIQDDQGEAVVANPCDFFAPMIYRDDDHMKLQFPSGELKISFRRSNHVPGAESYAVEIGVAGAIRRHLFTSDTRNEMAFSRRLDDEYAMVWHDCQLYDGGQGAVHISTDALKDKVRSYISRIDAKRCGLWLMHYNKVPTAEQEVDAQKWCEGFVKPGQVFDL